MAKFLIFSDPHFTDIRPKCRIDNYIKAQKTKMCWLYNQQKNFGGIDAVLCGGDVFDVPKPNPVVITTVLENCPEFFTTAGQHDLPRHSKKLINESGLTTLDRAGSVILLMENEHYSQDGYNIYGFPYGTDLKNALGTNLKNGINIAIVHTLISHEFAGSSAKYISKVFKNFDLIVSGDNHQTFVYKSTKYKNLIINAGSLMRSKADQLKHKPCIFIWDSNHPLEYERIYVPIKKDVINRDHIKITKEYQEMENEYVNKLNETYSIGMSYEENIKEHIETNNTREVVTDIIWDNVEHAKNKGQLDGKHKQKRNY
jgi:DNA repair protein SbcD/Mre11